MTDRLGVGTFIKDEIELGSSNLDLFTLPRPDLTVVHGKTVTYYPITALNDSGPFEFLITNDGNDYTYLPLTRLEGEIEVKKLDGTALGDTKNYLVNMFPHALFKQIECEVNGVQINDLSTPTYPYKAYIETHLSYSDDAKNTHLRCEYYEKDTVGKEGKIDHTEEDGNKRLTSIFSKMKKSLAFSCVLHLDFFQIYKYLLPGCNIKLKFIRHDDKFALIGDALHTKIHFKNLKISVRKLTIDPEISNSIENTLTKTPAIYPIQPSTIRTFLIHSGLQNERLNHVFRGKMPRSIIISFVNSKGFDGEITNNPFYFRPHGLNKLNVYINGEPLLNREFEPNYDNENAIREYRWFFDNTGSQHENETNGITYEEFCSNSAFFALMSATLKHT